MSKRGRVYLRQPDLEDDHVQSIWIKTGFKNTKPFYISQIYREHSSKLGNSLVARKQKLQTLLNHFQKAIKQEHLDESNEVHILGEMNIDFFKWTDSDYHLRSLASLASSQMKNFFYRASHDGTNNVKLSAKQPAPINSPDM